MPESQCLRIPLEPGETDTFLAWVERARTEHHEDMLRILRLEGMVAETMCLERGPEGDRLILYTRAQDLARAAEVMEASTHPFDVETRAVIARTWDLANVQVLHVLFEAARHRQDPGRRRHRARIARHLVAPDQTLGQAPASCDAVRSSPSELWASASSKAGAKRSIPRLTLCRARASSRSFSMRNPSWDECALIGLSQKGNPGSSPSRATATSWPQTSERAPEPRPVAALGSGTCARSGARRRCPAPNNPGREAGGRSGSLARQLARDDAEIAERTDQGLFGARSLDDQPDGHVHDDQRDRDAGVRSVGLSSWIGNMTSAFVQLECHATCLCQKVR